jgi:hypothetical protein
LSTGSDEVAIEQQVSRDSSALCSLGYHGFCSIRGPNVYKRAMSPPPLKAQFNGLAVEFPGGAHESLFTYAATARHCVLAVR